jgi:hypothetical protein
VKPANRFVWAVIAQAGLLPAVASAEMIVDTGPSPNIGLGDPGVSITNGSNNAAGSLQYLAGEFTTTQDYDITGLSAFVKQYANQDCGCIPLTATFELGLATGPAIPSASTFTTLLSLPASFTSLNAAAGWAGVSVPNYLLPAGTYWIVASTTATDNTFNLGMPGGVPNPLSAYAVTVGSPDNWQPLQPFDVLFPPTLGFQVEADPVSSVPLPGALGLLVSGIGALATLRRR